MSIFDRFKKKPEVVEVNEIEALELELITAHDNLFTAEDALDKHVMGSNPRYDMHKQDAVKKCNHKIKGLQRRLELAHIKDSDKRIREKDAKKYAQDRAAEIRAKTELRNLKEAMMDVLSDGDYQRVINAARVKL